MEGRPRRCNKQGLEALELSFWAAGNRDKAQLVGHDFPPYTVPRLFRLRFSAKRGLEVLACSDCGTAPGSTVDPPAKLRAADIPSAKVVVPAYVDQAIVPEGAARVVKHATDLFDDQGPSSAAKFAVPKVALELWAKAA